MTGSSSAQSDGQIETVAIEWLFEREQGFAPERARAFAAWCATDPRHADVVAELERSLGLLTALPKVKRQMHARLVGEQPARVARRGWRPFRLRGWAAGIAAALAIGTGVWWLSPGGHSDELAFITEANAPQQFALNDGSVVDVNANSKMQIRLRPHERHVELETGEAHFEVAHDPSRPFVVTAAGISVRALGTAFNVRILDTGVDVLVIEGRVEVSKPAGLLPVNAGVAPRQLGAAERIVTSRDDGQSQLVVSKVPVQEINHALAWHSTLTNFSNRPLREIVALFNRRNDLQLVLADAELGEHRIGGTFATNQPLSFVRLLEIEGAITAEKRGDREIVLRRAR